MKSIWLVMALLFAVWLLSGWRYEAQAQPIEAKFVLLIAFGTDGAHSQEFGSRMACESAGQKIATWGARTVCVPR